MSFPGHDQDNPQRVSDSVHTAGFSQDVVVATSRLIHGQSLNERDHKALQDCQSLLRRMSSTDVTFARSGDRQLAASNTVALLRKAGAKELTAGKNLTEAADAIDRVLAGERQEELIDELRQLREIFLTLGEVNLAAMTRRDPGQEGPDGWPPLITNSLS
jgi:hypothetical protein